MAMKINYQKETLKVLTEIRDLLKPKIVKEEAPTVNYDNDQYIKLEMKSHMTPKYLLAEMCKLFDVWVWSEDALDGVTSDRQGDYTVYFKDSQEADEENRNLSANDLKAKGHVGITLPERMLLEIEYFKKYGKHLDVESITLCTGSRNRDGDVPCVSWDSGRRKVSVRWCSVGYSGGFLRSRPAFLNNHAYA